MTDAGASPEGQVAAGLVPGRGRRRWITFAFGVVMVAAAAWAVLRTQGLMERAAQTLERAPWWMVGAALVLPVVNWLAVSWSFTVLTRRYGRVGGGEMSALIGAAWLLNYLPVRPGLIGRLAYHKKVNGIALGDSARVLGIAILLTGAALLTILTASAVQARMGLTWPALVGGGGGLGLIVVGVLSQVGEQGWRYAVAYAARLMDSAAWAARYLVVYQLVGQPITIGQAAAIAAVSQIVLLVPVIGNGLGLRELAVGIVGAGLPAWYTAGGTGPQRADGWAADLVNRAAELMVALPVGLACAGWVARRLAGRGAAAAGEVTPRGPVRAS